MFWKKEKSTDSQSLPLDRQVETSYESVLLRNLRFSLDFRIGVAFSVLIGFIAHTAYINLHMKAILPICTVILLYGLFNFIGKLTLKFKKKFFNVMSYVVPCFEILLATAALKWLNPYGPELLFFGADNVLFAVILANASLHTNRKQIALITTFLCVTHFIAQATSLTPQFYLKYSNTDLLELINIPEFLWYSFYYALIGTALYFKTREGEALSKDIKDVWIPKIIGGAYGDMINSESPPSTDRYSVFAVTQHPDKFMGADFFRAEVFGEDLALIVGDVVSHGINVSQGALVCLSAFQAAKDKDPAKVLEAVNRALIPIKQEHGGEAFVMAFLFKPDGTVVYNGYLDELCVMRMQYGEVVRIEAGREGVLLGKNELYHAPHNRMLKLYNHDNLVVLTDGAKNADEDDDKTSVIVTYMNPDEKVPGQQ